MIEQSFLNNLQNLSSEEKALVTKFQSDPTGATFLPIADLLRARGFAEEAIVLLEEGLARFPKYSSARAALAKDYYSQGLLEQALKESRTVLAEYPDNAQAHRILIRLLLIFDQREELLSRLRSTERIIPDDDLTQSVRKAISTGDWTTAQKWVRVELERSGVPALFPSDLRARSTHEGMTPFTKAEDLRKSNPTSEIEDSAGGNSLSWQVPKKHLPHATMAATQSASRIGASKTPDYDSVERATADGQPEALRPGSSLAHIRGDVDRYLLLRGFKSIPIDGFFAGRDGLVQSSGVEPLTLAEIYRSQGMYLRSMEIYERLLRESPRNIEYQAAYAELKEALKREYLDTGTGLEDASREQIQLAGKKIQKLRQLIGRLNENPV